MYDWTVNGTSAGIGTSTLTGAYFDRGDNVRCNVQPKDSLSYGTKVASNALEATLVP